MRRAIDAQEDIHQPYSADLTQCSLQEPNARTMGVYRISSRRSCGLHFVASMIYDTGSLQAHRSRR
ncbi:MAG: hypothetical protein JXA98_06990 [Methanosarcinaceae archaeon]|nr:hypothetical protein [Methanosarcinaceae archaeon]